MEIEHKTGDKYHVTGVDLNGRRFKIVTDNPHWALAINVYRGTVWQVRDGRRRIIRRIYN